MVMPIPISLSKGEKTFNEPLFMQPPFPHTKKGVLKFATSVSSSSSITLAQMFCRSQNGTTDLADSWGHISYALGDSAQQANANQNRSEQAIEFCDRN
jgi:hypothetical protein